MNDVRRLLAIKANIETAMQRDLAPHIRVFAQQQLDEVCKAIEEAWKDLSKLFEPQELDQLRARVKELEASNAELLAALEDCCVIAKPENPACCCPVYRRGNEGGCVENKDGECHIWKAIQKKGGGAGMSEQIDKSTQEWLKEIGAESPDAELKSRIAELEREVQEYKEENVKLLQTMLALYRAVKRANVELDKIEESCDNNVWFSRLKERTY